MIPMRRVKVMMCNGPQSLDSVEYTGIDVHVHDGIIELCMSGRTLYININRFDMVEVI